MLELCRYDHICLQAPYSQKSLRHHVSIPESAQAGSQVSAVALTACSPSPSNQEHFFQHRWSLVPTYIATAATYSLAGGNRFLLN